LDDSQFAVQQIEVMETEFGFQLIFVDNTFRITHIDNLLYRTKASFHNSTLTKLYLSTIGQVSSTYRDVWHFLHQSPACKLCYSSQPIDKWRLAACQRQSNWQSARNPARMPHIVICL